MVGEKRHFIFSVGGIRLKMTHKKAPRDVHLDNFMSTSFSFSEQLEESDESCWVGQTPMHFIPSFKVGVPIVLPEFKNKINITRVWQIYVPK